MRKQTKGSMTRKLDKIISEIVRSKKKCERCNKQGEMSEFDPAHIFSRTYRSVRWDFDNILCLCDSCHFWAHKNPILFAEFVRQYYGEEKYNILKEKVQVITKWKIWQMEDLYNQLKESQL